MKLHQTVKLGYFSSALTGLKLNEENVFHENPDIFLPFEQGKMEILTGYLQEYADKFVGPKATIFLIWPIKMPSDGSHKQ